MARGGSENRTVRSFGDSMVMVMDPVSPSLFYLVSPPAPRQDEVAVPTGPFPSSKASRPSRGIPIQVGRLLISYSIS